MSKFVVPIEGLKVRSDWQVGPVVVRPAEDALNDAHGGQLLSGREWFDEFIAEQKPGAFATVEADDLDSAIDLIVQAIDVLRVLQHVRHFATRLTQFGVAGDIGRGVVPFIQIEGEQAGHGFSYRGEPLGWTFDDPDEWVNAPVFQWVANAIGASSTDEAQRRGLVGIQLLSQALVEQRGTFKMVQLVGALEAWLLPRKGAGQTFRLARAVAFFGCGRHNNDLCGRSRDTCPYLELNPGNVSELKKLKRLRAKGANPPWRCAEWHRVVDWYDHRSDVVHGSGPTISHDEASNALYWLCRILTEPILQWLAEHPTDPVSALEAEIANLPSGPNWSTRLGSEI